MATTNSIGPNGLTLETLNDIVAELVLGFQSIYGAGINVGTNTPDGNIIQLFAQEKWDVEEFCQSVYDNFDPDQAQGVRLDALCAINGVTRQAGSYTQQAVQVVASTSLTLPGLNNNPTAPYTVADTSGNLYQLISDTAVTAGSNNCLFQASTIGPVSSLANTIQTPVTILNGVTSVNNSAGPTTIGLAEEAPVKLRIRRTNSVALPSQGWQPGLLGALKNISGVTDAQVIENNTGGTVNGTPANQIWCIVAGAPTAATVFSTIALLRNAGCCMRGAQTASVGGTLICYDQPTAETLYFQAVVTQVTGLPTIPALSFISAAILAQFAGAYTIGQSADATEIIAFIKSIAPGASVTGAGGKRPRYGWLPETVDSWQGLGQGTRTDLPRA